MTTLIVVPTYNESPNVTGLLNQIRSVVPEVKILIVDDSSPDGTADLVREHRDFGQHINLLSRRSKDGLGAAYRSGFAWAENRGFDRVVQMDADFSHPIDRIPVLLAALDEADVVVGSRYVGGGRIRNWPWHRRLISQCGNAYVRLMLRLPVRDATAGFKAFRLEALVRLGATEAASNGYCFQIENTWHACRLGMRVVEVPITFTDRTKGASKMTGSIVREALVRVLFWRWNELLGHAIPAAETAKVEP